MSDPASDWGEFAQVGQTPIVGASSPATEPGSLLKDIQSALWGRLRESSEDDRNAAVEEIADRYEQEWQARLQAAESDRDALAAFKTYVHDRLDAAGVPTHPDGPHSAEGCRVGDRLDVVIGERDRAQERVAELERANHYMAEQLQLTVYTIRDVASERIRANAAEERVRVLTAALEQITCVSEQQWSATAVSMRSIAREALEVVPATGAASGDDDAERAAEKVGS